MLRHVAQNAHIASQPPPAPRAAAHYAWHDACCGTPRMGPSTMQVAMRGRGEGVGAPPGPLGPLFPCALPVCVCACAPALPPSFPARPQAQLQLKHACSTMPPPPGTCSVSTPCLPVHTRHTSHTPASMWAAASTDVVAQECRCRPHSGRASCCWVLFARSRVHSMSGRARQRLSLHPSTPALATRVQSFQQQSPPGHALAHAGVTSYTRSLSAVASTYIGRRHVGLPCCLSHEFVHGMHTTPIGQPRARYGASTRCLPSTHHLVVGAGRQVKS